jgi:hypothetical protein
MGFKRVLNSRIAAVGAGAAVLAVLAGGVGYAAGEITSNDIQDNTIRSADVKDESLKLKDLSNGAQKQLKGDKGPAGEDGTDGTNGTNGEDGQDGASLAGSYAGQATIGMIGGSFVANSTQVGTLELPEAGTYVVNGYGFFDTVAADSERSDGTHLMLALRGPATEGNAFGADYGTCFTGDFPTGDRELTCQSVRTITVAAATTIRVIGFGYNEDTSGTGGGSFTVSADVSAIKVAPAA